MERSDWPAISVRLTAGVDAVVQLQYSDVRVKVRGKFHILDGVDGLRVALNVVVFPGYYLMVCTETNTRTDLSLT